jgi:alcohol dehydrogenase (cytochrome c)
MWAIDRETGKHLWNKQLVVFQNIYRSIDPKTGAVVMNEDIIPKKMGDSSIVCPGMRGGKLFQSKSYSPRSNAVYTSVSNECTENVVIDVKKSDFGLDYSKIVHMEGSAGKVGRLAAVSASTGKVLWNYDQRVPIGSILATGGGLIFAGDLYRYFRAFDADTGKVLWEIPLSAPVTGYPISYAVDGKQYVAVAVGGKTTGTNHMAGLYPELKVPGGSNVLMVFEVAP